MSCLRRARTAGTHGRRPLRRSIQERLRRPRSLQEANRLCAILAPELGAAPISGRDRQVDLLRVLSIPEMGIHASLSVAILTASRARSLSRGAGDLRDANSTSEAESFPDAARGWRNRLRSVPQKNAVRWPCEDEIDCGSPQTAVNMTSPLYAPPVADCHRPPHVVGAHRARRQRTTRSGRRWFACGPFLVDVRRRLFMLGLQREEEANDCNVSSSSGPSSISDKLRSSHRSQCHAVPHPRI